MHDKVSINVVTYNQENLIEETIESILAQTHQNIEILITDDCSTDKTPEIARRYEKQYPDKVRFLPSQKNQGVVANATKGLKAATGDYFCTFAGDDLMLPHNLESQLKLLKENPWAVMCHGNALWFDSATGKTLHLHHKNPVEETSLNTNLRMNNICGPASMVRREFLPPCYREEAGYACDWVYYIEILKHGNGVYIHDPIIKYRRHHNNLSNDGIKTRLDAARGLEYAYENITKNPNIFLGFSWLYGSTAKRYFVKRKYLLFLKYFFSFCSSVLKYAYHSTKFAFLQKK